MALLGLLLILAGGALAAGVVLGTTGDASIQVAWFDQTARSITQGGLFGLGAAAGIALMLGLALMKAGMVRSRRKRVERKQAAAESREEAKALEERNAELESKLAKTRAAAARRDELTTPPTAETPHTISLDEPEPAGRVTGRHRKR